MKLHVAGYLRLPILLIVAIAVLAACTDESGARRALDQAGITPAKVGGYAWFSCGRDDAFATHFEGQNVNGKKVAGAVCSGWFKGATIRFD